MTITRRIHHALYSLLFVLAIPVALAADSTKLAMRGYDPVNYFTEGRPAKGIAEFSFVWDGERYLFANARHRDMFASDPVRYAPQFPGHCAASLAGGQTVAANPEYWIIVGGKLYLFGAEAGTERFRTNAALIKKAEQNWPRLRKSEQ